jgi:hypothetical protein
MQEAGGALSVGGQILVPEAVSGVSGIPDGNYYVIGGVDSAASLHFSYQPAANASGTVGYTAYVRGQETGAANMTTTPVHGSFEVLPVNDGVNIAAPAAAGDEDQPIPLSIGVQQIDASEEISSIVLKVPEEYEGFLVKIGQNADGTGATLASNLGDGSWGLGDAVPAYVALVPPPNWSGKIEGIEVSVWSGEPGLEPTETKARLDVEVQGVADGITLQPTLSFGNAGEIVPLNLNSVMPDQDGSELATITVQGLGEYAAFYTHGQLFATTYDAASDTYTLSGLSAEQVEGLGAIQSAGDYHLTVTGRTTDGSDQSVLSSVNLDVDVFGVLATTGDDTLLYDGGALDGLTGTDTVLLRYGENLDFSNGIQLANIERIDLTTTGNHTVESLSLNDVLDVTGGGKELTILGDSGDSVSLKNGADANDQWAKTGSETTTEGTFDVYTNAYDATVRVLIEQHIQQHIDDGN